MEFVQYTPRRVTVQPKQSQVIRIRLRPPGGTNIQSTASTAVEQTTGASFAPAVIDITGDPGRIYRVQIPEAINAEIDEGVIYSFQVWSETMGDVSTTMTGRLNDEGHDRLRISGVLTTTAGGFVTNVSTAVPVGIDYE